MYKQPRKKGASGTAKMSRLFVRSKMPALECIYDLPVIRLAKNDAEEYDCLYVDFSTLQSIGVKNPRSFVNNLLSRQTFEDDTILALTNENLRLIRECLGISQKIHKLTCVNVFWLLENVAENLHTTFYSHFSKPIPNIEDIDWCEFKYVVNL